MCRARQCKAEATAAANTSFQRILRARQSKANIFYLLARFARPKIYAEMWPWGVTLCMHSLSIIGLSFGPRHARFVFVYAFFLRGPLIPSRFSPIEDQLISYTKL